MDPTPELAKKLEQDKREAAAAMTFGERLLAGVVMFDINMAMMRAGIRLQNPDADEQTIERLVSERLQKAHQRKVKK
jgi:hypothetical protein